MSWCYGGVLKVGFGENRIPGGFSPAGWSSTVEENLKAVERFGERSLTLICVSLPPFHRVYKGVLNIVVFNLLDSKM